MRARRRLCRRPVGDARGRGGGSARHDVRHATGRGDPRGCRLGRAGGRIRDAGRRRTAPRSADGRGRRTQPPERGGRGGGRGGGRRPRRRGGRGARRVRRRPPPLRATRIGARRRLLRRLRTRPDRARGHAGRRSPDRPPPGPRGLPATPLLPDAGAVEGARGEPGRRGRDRGDRRLRRRTGADPRRDRQAGGRGHRPDRARPPGRLPAPPERRRRVPRARGPPGRPGPDDGVRRRLDAGRRRARTDRGGVVTVTDGMVGRAEAILRAACGERVRTRFELAALTTFRIGGPAALFLEPESESDLIAVSEAVRQTGIPVAVLGKGSNVLVADEGFPGLVLRLGRGYRWSARDGERLTAGGAMPLPALAGVALAHGLSGLEFGVAIPASLGGAVRMNAGAHGGSLADVVESVDVFGLGDGAAHRVSADEAGFSYRRSDLPPGAVIVGATVRLRSGDPAEIRARMDEARDWRRRTQPLAEPNCGSVFKNPPGDHAARLIEEAGAKGLRLGLASISAKHANFVIASDGATAADVLSLIREVQDLVAQRSGIRLEPEVHLLGDLDLASR